MPRKKLPPNPGIHYDKFDIERLGLFGDPPGLSPLLKKVNRKEKDKPENSRFTGAQFTSAVPHVKDGTGLGYFDPEYKRIFKGEVIVRRKKKKDPRDDEILMPTNPTKWHSTPNDYYGCFNTYTYFALTREKKKPKKKGPEQPNCQIAPPGFFEPYPKRLDPRLKVAKKKKKEAQAGPLFMLNHYTNAYFGPDPYFVTKFRATYVRPKPKKNEQMFTALWNPGGPGKQLGGGKFGGFSKYPPAMSARLKKVKKVLGEPNEYGYPSYGEKSLYTRCINAYNVSFKCNAQNYSDFPTQYVSKYIK